MCGYKIYVWVTAERKTFPKYTLFIEEPVFQRVLENSVELL